MCVRRDAEAQRARIRNHCVEIAELLGIESPVNDSDIVLTDDFLAPGYGMTNPPTLEAMNLAARMEGLIVDPTYTAKSLAGFVHLARISGAAPGRHMLYIHTGGQPAIFASEPKLTKYFRDENPLT